MSLLEEQSSKPERSYGSPSTLSESQSDVAARMSSAKKVLEEKLMRKRIAALEPYDSETGQPLFSPVTNQSRSPSLLNRSTSRSSVERLSKPKASKQSVINYR